MRIPNFNVNPYIEIPNSISYSEATDIVKVLNKDIKEKNIHVITFDYYHGVDEKELYNNIISKLDADLLVNTDMVKFPEKIIYEKFKNFITDDRCNGVSSTCKINEFFDQVLINEAKDRINKEDGLTIVYGVGASVVCEGDLLIYCDIEMEEIKRRYKNGLDNWGAKNYDDDFLRKEKRFMFMESRVQDWHKRKLLDKMDYILDCNEVNKPVMISQETFNQVTNAFVSQPFQCIPFFSPGIWGGHWLKDKLGVGKDLPNTAWGMIGVLEFQAVQAKIGNNFFKMPGKNIYFHKPLEFLGGQVFYTYGYKVPLMLDILDTWGGQNLSLQCHPTVSYNQEVFNWPYGHYESYYMLDTCEESSVYLGTKDDVKIPEFISALKEAQKTGKFDETKWVNKFPMKKHDHVYIPSGTVHCSGANTLVLEINTFWVSTFKLWDWGRVDFDGKPRPIDIDHGEKVLQERHNTTFAKDRLISKRVEIDRGYGWTKEHSGLMEYEPLHVERYWFEKALHIETKETVKIICLVEGEEAEILSPNDEFDPFIIHYTEPIFIPAKVGQIYIKSHGKSKGKKLAVLEIYQDLGSKY